MTGPCLSSVPSSFLCPGSGWREVRALFSSVPSFLFLFSFSPHLGLHLQVGLLLPHLTLFIFSALPGVLAPFWHKPRTACLCWIDDAESSREMKELGLGCAFKGCYRLGLRRCHFQSPPGHRGKRAEESYVKEFLLRWKELHSGKPELVNAVWSWLLPAELLTSVGGVASWCFWEPQLR